MFYLFISCPVHFRSVPSEEKSFAIGIQFLLMRVLGRSQPYSVWGYSTVKNCINHLVHLTLPIVKDPSIDPKSQIVPPSLISKVNI